MAVFKLHKGKKDDCPVCRGKDTKLGLDEAFRRIGKGK